MALLFANFWRTSIKIYKAKKKTKKNTPAKRWGVVLPLLTGLVATSSDIVSNYLDDEEAPPDFVRLKTLRYTRTFSFAKK